MELGNKKWSVAFVCNLLLLLVVGLLFRVLFLETAPGISGDEAGVWVRFHDFIIGRPVSWATPTGKTISPLYLATLLPFEVGLPRSFLTLRIPGVLSGILLVVLTFFLSRRLFGLNVATISTAFVLTLPMHLVYSRLYIEQSLMGITCLLTLYYAMRGQGLKTLLWHSVALLIHPVNVFCTPIITVVYAHYLFFESGLSRRQKQFRAGAALALGVAGVLYTIAYVPKGAFVNTFTNLKQIEQLPNFLFQFVRIFSGVTPIQDLAGPIPEWARATLDVAFWSILLGGLFWGIQALKKKQDLRGLFLVLSWMVTIFIFYAVAGIMGVRPGLQRHSLYLMIPTVFCVAILWNAIFAERQKIFLWAGSGVAWLMLVCFGQFFLREFHETGGRSHMLYQTAVKEPKQLAHDWLVQDAGEKIVPVLAEDWWIYHPIRYLAKERENLNMVMVFRHNGYVPFENVEKIMQNGGYIVGWNNGRLHSFVRQKYLPKQYTEKTIFNKSNEPIVKIWRFKGHG